MPENTLYFLSRRLHATATTTLQFFSTTFTPHSEKIKYYDKSLRFRFVSFRYFSSCFLNRSPPPLSASRCMSLVFFMSRIPIHSAVVAVVARNFMYVQNSETLSSSNAHFLRLFRIWQKIFVSINKRERERATEKNGFVKERNEQMEMQNTPKCYTTFSNRFRPNPFYLLCTFIR